MGKKNFRGSRRYEANRAVDDTLRLTEPHPCGFENEQQPEHLVQSGAALLVWLVRFDQISVIFYARC